MLKKNKVIVFIIAVICCACATGKTVSGKDSESEIIGHWESIAFETTDWQEDEGSCQVTEYSFMENNQFSATVKYLSRREQWGVISPDEEKKDEYNTQQYEFKGSYVIQGNKIEIKTPKDTRSGEFSFKRDNLIIRYPDVLIYFKKAGQSVSHEKIIPQAHPILNQFKAVNQSDIKLFQNTYSAKMKKEFESKGWNVDFKKAKEGIQEYWAWDAIKKDLESPQLKELEFVYHGKQIEGDVCIILSKKLLIRLRVIKEGAYWKINEN